MVLAKAHRRCTIAAVIFDSLEYVHQLEAAGMSRTGCRRYYVRFFILPEVTPFILCSQDRLLVFF